VPEQRFGTGFGYPTMISRNAAKGMMQQLRPIQWLSVLAVFVSPAVGGSIAAAQGAQPSSPQKPVVMGQDSMWKAKKTLRVCADPDNMPFTNRNREGFDNKIAELIARELGDTVSYTWWPTRRGFVRNTLSSGNCDLIMGVPANYDPVATSTPYYRSTYYLVYRSDRNLDIKTLDDPMLKTLRIGVNLIGEDYTNTPPAHALSAHGIVKNVEGFETFYGEEHRPGEIIDSLAKGNIDVAIVWGPLAGYFASRAKVPMQLVPLPDQDSPDLPFAYDVTVGVRHSDHELADRVNEILEARKDEIAQVLREYNVPTVSRPAGVEKTP
jgi:quinoprotein dehydrogenase-associated probable ABC transporter substrate-binding protein